jgi:phosphatidylglycerophosphate synthase
MDLHRTQSQAEWTYVEPEDQNTWQKLADKTNGIITPGNAISVAGAMAVGSGLLDISHGKTTSGLFKIGAGRYADIVDGKVADKTGTKSPIGEGVDAVIDKIELGAALPVLLSKEIITKTAFGSILGLNLANAGVSAVAKHRKTEIHPSKAGKLATFGQWMAIGFYMLSTVSRNHHADTLAQRFETAGNISLVVATGLGIVALVGYTKDAFKPISEKLDSDLS